MQRMPCLFLQSSYRKIKLFKYEKSANCFSVLEERGLLFCLVNMKETFRFLSGTVGGYFCEIDRGR
jgi:hypothetical protein